MADQHAFWRLCAVWLKDIAKDYKAMNEAYSAWVDAGNKPIRATVQSLLAWLLA